MDTLSMLTRRVFLSEVCAALTVAGCSSSKPLPGDRGQEGSTTATQERKGIAGRPFKLTAINGGNALCMVGWHVARERGFFAAEGLDVELLPFFLGETKTHHPGPPLVQGPTGVVRPDITLIEYQNLADLAKGDGDYYVIAGEHSGCRQLIVPVASPVRTMADLAGKQVGVNPAYNDILLWEYLARQAGVVPASIQWVNNTIEAGTPEEIELVKREFAAGRLHAYAAADPVGEILTVDGIARRLASNTWTPPLNGWYCCMIGVRRAVVDANPEVVKAVTRAFHRSADFVEKSPAEAVALSVEAGYLSKDTRQDIAARLLGEYVWPATGRIREDLERYFQLLIEADRLPKSASPGELVARV